MIRVKDLYKSFKLYQRPADRLKEILLRRSFHRRFTALDGVSFEVKEGQTLGVIGQNGAGKTTLLKVLTGVLLPDSGVIELKGRITGLLELGTGFNSEFTGIQNIFLNGTLLGMTKEEINEKLGAIKAFSELGEFINEPLKTYSSGMHMRLAFSIAIHADPKAFVVDEALSVGDAYFQQKCITRIRRFKEEGGAIVFVSHDMNAVKVLCDRALLLDSGAVIEEGDTDLVINSYNFLLARKTKGEEIRLIRESEAEKGYGNLKVEIVDARLFNSKGEECKLFVSGERCAIAVALRANETVETVNVGILIRDRFGQEIFGTNTFHLNASFALKEGEGRLVTYSIDELNLGPGKYTLSVAAHRDDRHIGECYQWVDAIRAFEVVENTDFHFEGILRLKPLVHVESG